MKPFVKSYLKQQQAQFVVDLCKIKRIMFVRTNSL